MLIPFVLFSQTDDSKTYTKVGQDVPAFKVTALDGKTIDITAMKGKVVLLNFFATWCGPCMQEMPLVEKEIWQKLKSDNFVVLAVGREHSTEELIKFNKEKGFTFLIAPDLKRGVYSLFAKELIPRTYVIDKNGKIAFQSIGYDAKEFNNMIEEIKKLLKK
ncbi:MAG: protein-disulfide isomerase [Flavobacterium sp.]|nr:protein-disulfide isomerase [Flavobacterium sp.]